MGSIDPIDDMTFKINFSSEGLVKLRDKVNEKLKELMGDYTDDTLVDYVIILLRNGKRKEEARNELDMFLGDESDPFVSWLWDDVATNLDLYAQSQSSINDAAKNKHVLGDQVLSHHLNSDSDRDKSNKLSKRRRNSEWKGPVRNESEHPLLMSTVIDDSQVNEKASHEASHTRRPPSTGPSLTRKRSRFDDRQQPKRETVSHATANATRRLLQSAMRDAVESSRPSNSFKEPSLNRLRSVVSMSTSDSPVIERPRRIQSVARIPNSMKTVIKAVAEAAEDVRKAKSSKTVFDRLGSDMDVSETADQVTDSRGAVCEDDEYFNYNQILDETQSAYLQRSNYGGVRNITMLESEAGLNSDFISGKGYEDSNGMDSRVPSVPRIGTSGGNRDGGLMRMQRQYNMSEHDDDVMQDQLAVAANKSRIIVNSSVNHSSWKAPLYQESREISQMDGKNSVHEAGVGKSAVQLLKESSILEPVINGNAKHVPDVQKESQTMLQFTSGTYTAGSPLEDADSRTIFVNNVNFAATMDSLSRHFNKFGEVLKVLIVTDAATGQPKGSAFVEFMRKEAADNALSLDGTSFMSRIVKVVKRNAAHQEAAIVTTWPRASRGSPYSAARFNRLPFPRGMPSAYRPCLPNKHGARSFQWKRGDAQGTTDGVASFPGNNNLRSPTARSLTYVRTEAKPE